MLLWRLKFPHYKRKRFELNVENNMYILVSIGLCVWEKEKERVNERERERGRENERERERERERE